MDERTEEVDLAQGIDESASNAGIVEQIDSLNEQGWNLKKAETKRALRLAIQVRRVAEAHLYEKGRAYSLLNSCYCHRRLGHYDAALKDGIEAIALFERLEDKPGLGTVLNCLGNIYENLGEYARAIDSHSKSLQICQELGDQTEASAAINNLGRTYVHLGDYAKALGYFQQSLSLKEAGDASTLCGPLCNIGLIHEKLGEYEKAADYYQRALKVGQASLDTETESICLTNLGLVYVLMGNHKSALQYLVQAAQVAQRNGHKYPEATVFIYLGNLYQTIANYEKALECYQQGLGISQQIGHRVAESEALLALGELFYELEDYEAAIEHLLQAQTIAAETGNNEHSFKAHHSLSQVYEKQEDFAPALLHYKGFYTFRQKVFGAEADKNLQQVIIQAKVEQTQKESEIYRLKHVELAARVRELEEALAQIKQLQSLLPVCSYCKLVRNDANYWQSVESYISENTETQFSHGICPSCYEKVVQPQLEEMKSRRKLNESG